MGFRDEPGSQSSRSPMNSWLIWEGLDHQPLGGVLVGFSLTSRKLSEEVSAPWVLGQEKGHSWRAGPEGMILPRFHPQNFIFKPQE